MRCAKQILKNIFIVLTYAHDKNMTRLWCKIVLKSSVEQTKRNERSYFYLYPFVNLAQKNFKGGFYVCIKPS
jgi:hypothetical protein